MSKDRKEPDHPAELETQFILRLPEEPAKHLRGILKTDGDTLKNRLAINVENDMRHGEVKLDHWTMHAKVVDLPTVVESLKTIDNKSFYKTADICQMMVCKEEPDQPSVEDEAQSKSKKKDHNKVDKKFLFPHGITPPTKNVRKRRFRKTLKKKYVDAPEIEKEVKRLLRADNEADNVTWEILKDEEVLPPSAESTSNPSPMKATKPKKERARKRDTAKRDTAKRDTEKHDTAKLDTAKRDTAKRDTAKRDTAKRDTAKHDTVKRDTAKRDTAKRDTAKRDTAKRPAKVESTSRVVDIFGGAVSDSDLEDNANANNANLGDSKISAYDTRISDVGSLHDLEDLSKADNLPVEFSSLMFDDPPQGTSKPYRRHSKASSVSTMKSTGRSSDDDGDMSQRIEEARKQLEELKQRKQRTQNEIAGMDNLALRQRFQDILHTLNQDIMYKEMQYQGMITLQNSEDI